MLMMIQNTNDFQSPSFRIKLYFRLTFAYAKVKVLLLLNCFIFNFNLQIVNNIYYQRISI